MENKKMDYFLTEDVVLKVAEMTQTTKVKAREAIDAVFDSILTLAKDESKDGVQIPGKFTLKVTHVENKTTRNPKTGETQITPAHNKASVKLSGKVKEVLR